MPIKHENKKRYPQNWKEIRADILKRANNRCEFCGIENYSIRENGSKVVLTVAHLDHTPENCDYGNLRALCQKCHNNYDKEHRAETRRKTREERDMILKTIDGYETTVHPSMEQVAIDQGIRPKEFNTYAAELAMGMSAKPVGYDAPITGWGHLTTDQLFDLHKGIHDRAVKDTVDKVLEILDTAHFDLDDSARERDVYMRVSEYRKWMKKAVKELASERTDGND